MPNFSYNSTGRGGMHPLWSILIIVAVMIGLFMLARLAFRILLFLSPLLLVATLFIDRSVILDYGRWVQRVFKKDTLLGIGAVLLTIVGFPVVSLFLLGRALFKRKLKQVESEIRKQQEGELTDFEELESKRLDFDRMERPDESSSSDYEDFFRK